MRNKIEFGDLVYYNGKKCQVLAVGFIGECKTPLCLLEDGCSGKYVLDKSGNVIAVSVYSVKKVDEEDYYGHKNW